MGKMIRINEGNVVRPRRSTHWTADVIKPRKLPVFKIGENDFLSESSATSQLPEKSPRVRKTLRKQLEKYCESSTLHGLRYVGDSQLTFGERIFWFVAFSLAIGFAAYYISNIYVKWQSSPVIISSSPFDVSLSAIPFPAITICNMNQAKKSEAERILKEGSDEERKLLDDACSGNATFDNTENTSWQSLRNFLVKVGNSCTDMVKLCQWGSEKVDCDDVFNNELTDEGLCCSFNRLPPEKIFRNMRDISILNQTYPGNVYDWNAERGFENSEYDDTIPKRPLGAGAHLGLSVVLDAQIDNYYCSSTRSIGFKVILSNPIETPKMVDFGFLVNPGFETRIAIEPSIRSATSTLRSVPVEKRQCYFSNERPLRYYRTYSQRNCNQECQSNHTLSLCKCIPYYLPKARQIKSCGKAEKQCVEIAKINMETTYGNGSSCHCLPSCFSISYEEKKSYASLSKRVYDDFPTVSEQSMAVLHFYFHNSKFTKALKSELYGFTEILSNTGGLLSLCLGFSFLSLVELLYFLTLRVACDIAQRTRKNNKKKSVIPFLR